MKIPTRDMPINERYIPLLRKWKRFNSRYRAGDLLVKMGYKDIAIYGGGTMGTLLYEELAGSEINVSVIIDKEAEPMFPYDLEVIPLEKLNASYRIDAVVLTPLLELGDSVNIEERIKRRINCDVLSLDNDLIVEIDLIDCMKKSIEHVCRSGARIMFMNVHPKLLLRIKNPSTYEKLLAYCGEYFFHYRFKFPSVFDELYDDIEYYSEEYYSEITIFEHIERDGAIYLCDAAGLYRNTAGGCRITADVPDKHDNTIYMYGPCWVKGTFAEDKYTIQSYLQRLLNDNVNYLGREFRVANYSAGGAGVHKYHHFRKIMQ
ncbi:MAG: hypothetical protein LBU13_00400 [Synergistaceae bacterium]|jgi:hypothetical protein|nr:hypothetical protein [Synergistaceae bacterium]